MLPIISEDLFQAKSASMRGDNSYKVKLIGRIYDEQPALAGMVERLLRDESMGSDEYRDGYITGILSVFDLFSTQAECNCMEDS